MKLLYKLFDRIARSGQCHGLQWNGSVTYSRHIGPFRFFSDSAVRSGAALDFRRHEILYVQENSPLLAELFNALCNFAQAGDSFYNTCISTYVNNTGPIEVIVETNYDWSQAELQIFGFAILDIAFDQHKAMYGGDPWSFKTPLVQRRW